MESGVVDGEDEVEVLEIEVLEEELGQE